MADFDSNFARALESKLRNQDANSAANTTTANAAMMNAQTHLGLAPSEGLRNVGMAQAGLMDAGSRRMGVASDNPMGFSSTQVNSMGLGALGITPTGQANNFSTGVYGSGQAGGNSPAVGAYLEGMKSRYGSGQPAAMPASTMPTSFLPSSSMDGFRRNNLFGGAHGGVIGDVEHDEGRDTIDAKVRPGEYMLDPKVVAKGFGGGDHATGVRNLNDIVRRAGGYEPGPTVAKKGKKGFAQSGGAGDPRRRRAPPTIPNPAAVFAAHPAVASAPSPYLAETAGKPALPPSNDFLTSGLFGDQTPAPVPQAPIAGNMHGLFNKLMPPPAAPSTGALTAPLPPQPTLKNMAQTAVAENASALPKVPLITESGNGFQIRDAIQAGGRPGSQISFNYGAGHGMEAGAAPIVATADKTGKFNQFGNMGLRAARGGVVPGFQESGVVKPGFFPVPAGPLQDVTDLGARAQLAQDRWDKRWTAGLEAKAAADAEAAAAAKAAEAEAVRSGKSFTEGMRNTYQQPIGAAAKAGAQRAYEIGKAVLPEAATIGKVARGVSRTMPYVGAGMAGVDLVDVASDPNKTKGDVVNEAAGQAGRLGAAGVGAYGGAMLGAMTGPGAVVASPVLAALGGIGGYMGAGKLIHAGREFFGADPRDPSETSQGWFKKKGETPTAADVPQAAAVAEKPAAPAAPEKPSLRDIMMLRAMALGGGGTGAMKEQGHLLGYLGQTEGLGNASAIAAAKLHSENEKEIDASIKGLLQKSVTDPKTGKTEKVDDLAAEQRMRADLTAHRGPDGQPIDIYKMDRRQRDAVINEWVERDRAQQKLKARQVESGDKKQLVSDRTRPITLKQGGMGLGDWWGSPNIKFWDDYVPSFYGGGLRNKVAQVPVLDPTTGKPTIQSFPATVPFTNEQGFPDLEALSHARNAGK